MAHLSYPSPATCSVCQSPLTSFIWTVALRPTFGSNYLHVVLYAPTAFRRASCSLSKVVTHENRTINAVRWDH
jgi:hypothetical protein